jgi:SAM-dependent methyltransferase
MVVEPNNPNEPRSEVSALGGFVARYADDGESVLKLSDRQKRLAHQVVEKLHAGAYRTEVVVCPVCRTSFSNLISQKDRYGIPMTVRICRDCGLVFTSPRMDQASYAEFYNDEYRPLYGVDGNPYERLYEKQCYRQGPRIAAFLERSGIDLRGKKVFEVGCGAGGILACLRDRYGCVVAGCDFGEEALAVGRRRGGLELRAGDLRSGGTPWPADVIIYSHVMEHILDPVAEGRAAAGFLAPGGVVYIEVPSIKNIRNSYRWDLLRYLQNAHTFHFSLATLTSLMSAAGFSLVRGTEAVRSVYRPAASPGFTRANDYEDVVRYIRATEWWRPLMYWVSLAYPPKRLAVNALEAAGLFDFVDRRFPGRRG